MTLTLGELWRYPVTSLAGERLAESMLTTDGVPGDRLVHARRAAGHDAWLHASDPPDRLDILPLLVATDGAVRAFGRDVRRLRPNLVISGVDGLAKREWEDAGLAIGDAAIYLDSLRGRCPMTTVDPDSRDVAVGTRGGG